MNEPKAPSRWRSIVIGAALAYLTANAAVVPWTLLRSPIGPGTWIALLGSQVVMIPVSVWAGFAWRRDGGRPRRYAVGAEPPSLPFYQQARFMLPLMFVTEVATLTGAGALGGQMPNALFFALAAAAFLTGVYWWSWRLRAAQRGDRRFWF